MPTCHSTTGAYCHALGVVLPYVEACRGSSTYLHIHTVHNSSYWRALIDILKRYCFFWGATYARLHTANWPWTQFSINMLLFDLRGSNMPTRLGITFTYPLHLAMLFLWFVLYFKTNIYVGYDMWYMKVTLHDDIYLPQLCSQYFLCTYHYVIHAMHIQASMRSTLCF